MRIPNNFAEECTNTHLLVERRTEYFRTRRARDIRYKELKAEGYQVVKYDSGPWELVAIRTLPLKEE